MPTNLTDRLGELVDKVTPGPVFAAAKPSSVVGWPVVAQSGRSVCSMNYIQHSAIDPKISGDDAFNRESKANAEFIALCFTHKDEILSALRKAEQPVERDEKLLAEITEMMSAHVDNWPSPKKVETAISLIDKTLDVSRFEVALLREQLEAVQPAYASDFKDRAKTHLNEWYARLSLGDEK